MTSQSPDHTAQLLEAQAQLGAGSVAAGQDKSIRCEPTATAVRFEGASGAVVSAGVVAKAVLLGLDRFAEPSRART